MGGGGLARGRDIKERYYGSIVQWEVCVVDHQSRFC